MIPGSSVQALPGDRHLVCMWVCVGRWEGLRGSMGVSLSVAVHVLAGKKKRGTKIDVLRQPFDRIVFNFPHVGLGIKDQATNVEVSPTKAKLESSSAPLGKEGGGLALFSL